MKHDTEDQEKLRKEQDSVDETVVVDNSNVIDNVSINVSLKNEFAEKVYDKIIPCT